MNIVDRFNSEEPIVSVCQFLDTVYLATKWRLFRVEGDTLVQIKMEQALTKPKP